MCAFPSLPLGHYNVNESSITVISVDLSSAFNGGNNSPTWTFEANSDQRINFNFSTYYFSFNIYEIGDGLVRGESTRLARFKGIDQPSNVTSVSSCAWLSVDVLSICQKCLTNIFKSFWQSI